jgi:hypothetical protein
MRAGFIALAVCVAALAQSEPEFSDVVFRLDGGKLAALERQDYSSKVKASGFLVIGVKGVIDIPGKRSPVRLSPASFMEFVVRNPAANSTADPAAMYHLRKLTERRGHREAVISAGRATPIGATMRHTSTSGLISLEFAQYGKSSYRIRTPALSSGEYALGRVGGGTVFCFGVD